MTGPWPFPNQVQVLWSSASSFNFYYLLFSLGSTSSCLRLLSHLTATSTFASIKCFGREVLCKMLTNPVSLVFFIYVGSLFFLWIFVTLLHFSHDMSNWSSPALSSTTLQILKCSCDLPSQMFKFQDHQNYITNFAFINCFPWFLSNVLVKKVVECWFCCDNPGFKCMCTYSLTSYR